MCTKKAGSNFVLFLDVRVVLAELCHLFLRLNITNVSVWELIFFFCTGADVTLDHSSIGGEEEEAAFLRCFCISKLGKRAPGTKRFATLPESDVSSLCGRLQAF